MSRGAQLKVSKTKTIPNPSLYIDALYGECGAFCLDEEAAPQKKGLWRKDVFKSEIRVPLDLEIGTGNGYHFSHQALKAPERNLIGIELKYKPLIQSIRRVMKNGGTNARMVRYNAVLAHELFDSEELDNVYIHFPDPWSKLRQHKHRLIQTEFLNRIWEAQRPGSFIEFKTDSRDYFDWALEKIATSSYTIVEQSFDLHQSPYAEKNFITQFERIFMNEGIQINYALLKKIPQK